MAAPIFNYWAIIVSSIAGMLIGAFWYSQAGFGKAWMQLMSISKKDIGKAVKMGGNNMGGRYATAFIGLLVMNYVLSAIIDFMEGWTFSGGLKAGFFVWLGFIAPTMLGIVLWENKPQKLYWINSLHYLVALLVMGAILAVWQ